MAVREGLLSLLEEGPRHGYQLKTAFESVTGGVWPLNVGQVYTTLERLERDGLVTMSTAERGAAGDATTGAQKVYGITVAGLSALGEWWQAVPADEPPPRDELMLKVLMGIERGRDHALDVIARQRRALFALLQAKRRQPATSNQALAAQLVVDALVVRAEADLRWLDMCESRLTFERQKGNHR